MKFLRLGLKMLLAVGGNCKNAEYSQFSPAELCTFIAESYLGTGPIQR